MKHEMPFGQGGHHKTIPPPAFPITALSFITGVTSASPRSHTLHRSLWRRWGVSKSKQCNRKRKRVLFCCSFQNYSFTIIKKIQGRRRFLKDSKAMKTDWTRLTPVARHGIFNHFNISEMPVTLWKPKGLLVFVFPFSLMKDEWKPVFFLFPA